MTPRTVVGLGEVLWDVFPEYKQLGGAPANYAYISSLLGEHAMVASRIGRDALGDQVVTRLNALGLSTDHLQRDSEHPTGTAQVALASDGQPQFEIVQPVAWDFLAWTPEFQALAETADAACFGTLAQRNRHSADTIQRFVGAMREEAVRVFDVNLRQTFYSKEMIVASSEQSNVLKANHEELPLLLRLAGAPELDDLDAARWLCERFGFKLVCITRGAHGSLLVTPSRRHEHPGYRVHVADTVGAGDAFTATLVHHFLRGSDLATMNDAANRMGAWVASQRGGTPAFDRGQVEKARAQGA